MNELIKKCLISAVVASVITGCASKDAEYVTASSDQTQTVSQDTNTVDSKMDAVAGEESAVESTADTMTSESIEQAPSIEEIISDGINVTKSELNGELVLLKSVHFAFDKFELNDEMRQIATNNASKIQEITQHAQGAKIKLEGNCDEWGTDEYNYALGLKRAKTAKDALIADGISEDRISMVSFGESNPVCKDKNVACWKLNRRVDYKILP